MPPERSTAARSVVVLVVAGLGAVALLVVLAAVGFFVFAAGDDDEAGPGTTVAAGPATTVAGGGETTAPATVSIPVPNISTRPADLDITLADSPWLPTPCPEDQERVACILGGVSVDEESGEMLIPYFTEGFTPELEPPGFHIHFYLDTAVDGDERKAGSAVPGGSWKPWDGPFPFESFGGENGRSGFTLADAEAADASQVCAIVADADLEALPGTGNCAPIARYFDPDGLTAQVNRLEGRFIGRCGIGTTMIVPDGWRAVDLVTLGPAEAARDLRPTDVAAMTTTLEGLVDDGGVLWADGPVEDGFIVNLSLSRIEVDVSTASTPDEVRAALAQRGVDLAGASDRTIGGRPALVQVVQGGDSDQLTYVTPDFGYAIVLTFTVPDASAWTEPADAMAATVQGC